MYIWNTRNSFSEIITKVRNSLLKVISDFIITYKISR